MTSTPSNINQEEYLINPKKVVLWLLIVASVMLFAAFTSAYIVRRGEGNWEVFNLPLWFGINTGVIALSSLFMQLAYQAAKQDELGRLKLFLVLTLSLGVLFCFGQWMGWNALVKDNVFFAFSNPSNSFVYVITGVHLFHIVGAIIFLFVMTVQSFQFKLHKKNLLYLGMCNTYWHFIGIIWIYLYLFLSLNR